MQAFLASEIDPTSFHGSAALLERMEAEFEACQREHRPVVLWRVAVDALERHAADDARKTALLGALARLVAAFPRSGALYVAREGDALLVLSTDTKPEAGDLAARLAIDGARKLALPGAPAPVRASLSIGIALSQPDLDLWFETLRRVAADGAAVASTNG